ncbi:transferase [Desulfovibrio sp. OttesenSCG-928-C06]|nr:transferase [Desulfovibrio sp. OttesenSCG-928-C06]
MRRELVIIGNSGAARECYWLAQDMIKVGADFTFKGFLAFEGYEGDLKELSGYFLGSDDEYTPDTHDVFSIGIGHAELRRRVYSKWKDRGVVFKNLIHPTAAIQESSSLGEANIVARDAAISCNVNVGCCNFINGGVIIGHDVNIGDVNIFAPRSVILSDVTIGANNLFGAQSVVFPGATVGNNNILAAGAFLYKGCRDKNVMAGNPAHKVGEVTDLN